MVGKYEKLDKEKKCSHANDGNFRLVSSSGCSAQVCVHFVVHDRPLDEKGKVEYRKITNYEFNIKTEIRKNWMLESQRPNQKR